MPVKAVNKSLFISKTRQIAISHWNQILNTLYMQCVCGGGNKLLNGVLHCIWHLPHPRCSRHLRNGNGSQPVASCPLGSHVTIQNIQLLPKSFSHNIHHCVPPPHSGSRSHGTLIGNQYGATQPWPKMPFWQNVFSHWTLPQTFILSTACLCACAGYREYLSYAAVWTRPSQQGSIHIPDWEKKEEGKRAYPLM